VKEFWKKGENQRRGKTRGELRFHHSKVRVELTFINLKSMILIIAINMIRCSFKDLEN